MKVYIAGPMRGYDHFNFPAFDAARDQLHAMGHQATSPADMDREQADFDETANTLDGFCINDAARRDLEAIIAADAVVLIDGWEESKGATAEMCIAFWLGRRVFELVGGQLLERQFIPFEEGWTRRKATA